MQVMEQFVHPPLGFYTIPQVSNPSGCVRKWLHRPSPLHWIGRRGPVNWLARSPDFTALCCYLWGQSKSLVGAGRIQTPTHLQECTIDTSKSITSVTTVWWLTGYLVCVCVSVIKVHTLTIYEHKPFPSLFLKVPELKGICVIFLGHLF